MACGTFANIRLVNKLAGKPGPQTLHHPSGEMLDIYDAASRYSRMCFQFKVYFAAMRRVVPIQMLVTVNSSARRTDRLLTALVNRFQHPTHWRSDGLSLGFH